MQAEPFTTAPFVVGQSDAAPADTPHIPIEEALCPIVSHEWVNSEYKHLVVDASPKALAHMTWAGVRQASTVKTARIPSIGNRLDFAESQALVTLRWPLDRRGARSWLLEIDGQSEIEDQVYQAQTG